MENKSTSKALWAAIVIIIVGVVIFFLPKKTSAPQVDTTETNTPVATDNSSVDSTSATSQKSKYKDGTYTAMGSYNSPGGPDDLTVSVTLKDDIIVDSTVTNGAHDPKSTRIQNDFIANYKPFVTGKNIDEVYLTKVSGSSLTGAGFNDALAKIKVQAQG